MLNEVIFKRHLYKSDTKDCKTLQCQRAKKCKVHTKKIRVQIPAGRRVPMVVGRTWNYSN